MKEHRGADETTSRSELRDLGMQVRREVLGDEYVDRSIAAMTDLSAPLQRLVTEYCWGAVWGRPGLERRTRSLINIAMLAALNKPHELETHLRGALRNGCTVEEIGEVVLQAAVYCGLPAGLEAMKVAQKVVDAERV